MTNQRKFEIGLFLAALVVAVVFGVQWVKAREANIRAEAVQQANDKANAAMAQERAKADAAAQQYAAALAKPVVTQSNADAILGQYLASLKAAGGDVSKVSADGAAGKPVVAAQPLPTVKAGEVAPVNLPDAPAGTTLTLLTPEQVIAAAQAAKTCDANTNSLNVCRGDKVALQAQLGNETKTAETWKAAAKGGSKWTRFGRVAKLAGCGAGGGAGGAVLDKSHAAQGAAIGAVAGVVVCSLFGK